MQPRRLLATFPVGTHHTQLPACHCPQVPFSRASAPTHRSPACAAAWDYFFPSTEHNIYLCLSSHYGLVDKVTLQPPRGTSWPTKQKQTPRFSLFKFILLHDCSQRALVISQASSVFLDQKSWAIRSWILSNLSISLMFFIVCFYEFIPLSIVEELALGRQIVSFWSWKSGNCYCRKQVYGEMHFISPFVLSWWCRCVPKETNKQWCWFFCLTFPWVFRLIPVHFLSPMIFFFSSLSRALLPPHPDTALGFVTASSLLCPIFWPPAPSPDIWTTLYLSEL